MRSKYKYFYWCLSLLTIFQFFFPVFVVRAEGVIKNISATALVDGLIDSGTVFSYTSKDTITATTPKSNIYNFKLNPDLLVFFENKTIENERPCSEEYICFFFDGTITTPVTSSVLGYISVSTQDLAKGKAVLAIDSGTVNLQVRDAGSFKIANAGTFAEGTDYKVLFEDVKINGHVMLDSINSGGNPQLGDNGFYAMLINLYSYDGNDIPQEGTNGAMINKDSVIAGIYRYNQMTLKEPLYSNTVYNLQVGKGVFNSDELFAVNCTTMEVDITAPCGIRYTGSMEFTLDASGKITVLNGTEFENKANGLNIKSLTSVNGINLEVKETLDSPLDKALSSAIKTLAGFVGSFMKTAVKGINDLLDNTADIVLGDGVTTGVESAWTKIRNIALTLLIMALTIIAFANVLQIDIEHYGLNRMIPRIIISIIMAYLSWLIVTFFFDFTKALQEQATGLLSGSSGLDALANISINTPTGGDIMAKAGSVLVLLVLLIGILICLVILWFSLLMRVVVLSFLLAVAPLAFILNIMPFTSKLYKQWWSEFFKWMFMGPIAVTIIALGSIIASSSFEFSGAMTLSGDSTAPDGSGWNILIGLLILGASIYFAATLPQKWGGKIMGGWQKAGKNIWGKTGGAAWKASSIPGAFNTIKGSIGDRFSRGLKQRENKLAFGLSGGKAGIDPRAMKRSLVDAQAQTYRKQFETARVSKDELNNYAIHSKGPKALAAWQILQDKDWMPSDPTDQQTQPMWDKYYADNGIEAGDSLYWGNRKKHPQLQDVLTTARSRAGAAAPNPKLSIESLMGGMGDADYPDIEKDALKLRAVASKLSLTDKRAESLKPEQVDALTGNSTNAEALKTLLNHAGPGGKSFKDGLTEASAANNSGAVKQNLEVIREKVARDFGDVGIQHLDDKSLLTLINKRF